MQKVNSYRCQKCRDTGWILKYINGKQVAVSCECREKEIIRNQWKRLGITLENSKQTFKSFKEWNEYSSKAKSVAISYFIKFKENIKSRNNSFLICGQVGSGKTHLSIALALNLIKDNYKVVYMPYRDVITKIKQNILDDEVYSKIISKYKNAQILLIDDLYKGKISRTDVNIMFEIINYRYINYKPIIISSEFCIDEILSFDESIGSRIYEMCKNYIIVMQKGKENNYRLLDNLDV